MIESWKELSREVVVHKYGRGMERVIFCLPDGQESDFYLKKENDSVCVLAFTEDNEVILAQQFRPGPKEVLWELPGGGLEEGESPIKAIGRELLEETGYAGDIQFVTQVYACGYSTMRRNCFVATNCRKVAEQNLDDGEYVEAKLMSLPDFRNHLRSGKLTDVETGYAGLDYLGLL